MFGSQPTWPPFRVRMPTPALAGVRVPPA